MSYQMLPPEFQSPVLTRGINMLPYMVQGIITQNLFTWEPGLDNVAKLEVRKGSYHLIPTQPWGTEPTGTGTKEKREMYLIDIPHTPKQDYIPAEEINGVRAFNTDRRETMQDALARATRHLRLCFDRTRDYRQFKALTGVVVDADGSVLFNAYDFFGITQKVVDFDLGDPSTDVVGICESVSEHVETHAFGEPFSDLKVLCTQTFHRALVTHPNVEKIFLNWAAAQQNIGADTRKGFRLGGLVFDVYNDRTILEDGTQVPYLGGASGTDKEGIVYPLGTVTTFKEFGAPAVRIDTVNKKAQLMYMSSEIAKHGKGIELLAESNYIPMCCRPTMLVKIISST